MTEPLSYRCETCQSFDGMEWDDQTKPIRFKKVKCKKKGLVHENDDCASHSSARSERDKVLEELRTWFDNYCESNEEPDLYMTFLKAYRILRQQGINPRSRIKKKII